MIRMGNCHAIFCQWSDDLTFISEPRLVSFHGQLLALGFSYHDLSFLPYILKLPRPPLKFLQICNFCRIDLEKLDADSKIPKIKKYPKPFKTEEIQIAIRQRNQSFLRFKKNRSEDKLNLTKTTRSRYNHVIRNAKRRHIIQNIKSSFSSNIWKFNSTLGIGKRQNQVFK